MLRTGNDRFVRVRNQGQALRGSISGTPEINWST